MKTCQYFQAQILELEELGPTARSELEQHAEICRGCGATLRDYRGIMTALRGVGASAHVEAEHLTRFAIYRAAPTEPDYDQTRMSDADVTRIENHIGDCSGCRSAVNSIIHQYSEMDHFLAEAGVPSVSIDPPMSAASARNWFGRALAGMKSTLVLRPAYPAGGLALAAAVVLLWMSPWLRDPYDQLAFVETAEESFLTRDGGSELSRGVSLLNDGRYPEAIERFERFIEVETDDRFRNYAHYLSGMACLSEARTELLGRVLSYDDAWLDRGMDHLETVIQSDREGRIREDAYWLLGKAHLMKKQAALALEAFREVAQMGGRQAGEARRLIEAIEAIEGSLRL
ncbi:MAG TPA: tetratricopeptide repeat protein [Vicinamibacteria bacterium]|nr:tetratricopeptide repeat protein [Vicinamibacteria bacterium]